MTSITRTTLQSRVIYKVLILQNLKKQGYRRISPDDPEAKGLLDLDDLSEEDEYYILSSVKNNCSAVERVSIISKDQGPPSYEEAQNQPPYINIPKYQVLGVKGGKMEREEQIA